MTIHTAYKILFDEQGETLQRTKFRCRAGEGGSSSRKEEYVLALVKPWSRLDEAALSKRRDPCLRHASGFKSSSGVPRRNSVVPTYLPIYLPTYLPTSRCIRSYAKDVRLSDTIMSWKLVNRGSEHSYRYLQYPPKNNQARRVG